MEFHYERFIRVKLSKGKKAFLLALFIISLPVLPSLALLIFLYTRMWFVGLIVMCLGAWLLYIYASRLYVEYEYQFTNTVGSLDFDITKIINQKKRKEMFSLNCREFEIVAKMNGSKDNNAYRSIANRYECVKSMNEEDIFFIVTNTDEGRTIIYVQLNEAMTEGFRKTMPSKFFE